MDGDAEDKRQLVLGNVRMKRQDAKEGKLYGSLVKGEDKKEGQKKSITGVETGQQTTSKWSTNGNWKISKRFVFWMILTMCGAAVLVLCPTILVFKKRSDSAVTTSQRGKGTSDIYCETDHCRKIASSMFARMDPDVDPCDDFYEYSCGGWIRSHEVPPGLPTINTLYEMRDTLARQIKVLIEKPIRDDDIPVIKEAKRNYMACTDADRLEERDSDPLIELLETLGGWPILGTHPGGRWEESTFDLTDLLSTINRVVNQGFIIQTFVGRDDKNSSRYSLLVDQGKLGLPNTDFYNQNSDGSKYLMVYLEYMKTIVRFMGVDAEDEDVNAQIYDVIDFERKIAAHMKSETQRRHTNDMYHRTTVSDLQVLVPQVDWLRYFNIIGGNKSPIGPTEQIIITSPGYVRESLRIANDETSPRTVVNYVLWRVVMKFVNNLSRRFRKASAAFGQVFVEPEDDDYDIDVGSDFTESSRGLWKRCVQLINAEMSFVTGRMYVSAYYDDANQEPVNTMMSFIEDSFIDMVTQSKWMDGKTKSAAIDKVKSIDRQIGYPDWIMDDENLQLFYQGLNFSTDDHFGNYLGYLGWNFRLDFSKLRDPPSEEWARGPASVNAYYSFTNILTVPAGILQPLFYDMKSPVYLNFGGIGMVIGHELTHGFDDKGRMYDKYGHLRESWWSRESQEAFNKHSQCIIDQYGRYTVKECNTSLNGHLTVGENIADNGGIKEAYKAYQYWKTQSGTGPTNEPLLRLPGLELNREQLLFVNYAQVWCSKFTTEGARNQILTGRHSPGRFRVIGALSNLPDFSRVFGCKSGTTMNPAEKCEIW